MLSKQEDFDRNVKRVLQEVHGEEIPFDFLVDIEQRLNQLEKKKKRRFFMWFFTGIVLASGLTFGLVYEKGSSNKPLKKILQKGTSSVPKTMVFKSITSNKAIKSKHKDIVQISVNKVLVKNTSLSTSTTQMLESANRLSLGDNLDFNSISSNLSGEISSISRLALSQTPREIQSIISDGQLAKLSSIDSTLTKINDGNESLNQDTLLSIKTSDLKVENVLPKWTHSIGFYSGMSGVISSFQTDNQVLISSVGELNTLKYRELRSTQERSTSSIDLSLRYRMSKEHLVLQTGVDFFEWGEQIKYDYSFTFDGVNRYSYVSVPFYLGYRKAFHGFEWSANIGCSVGHVLQQQGRYIQPDLVTLALENAHTWTTTGMAQVEFVYIFDRYRFAIAPTYRMTMGNLVNSTFTKNRYFSFGLQMGMAYQF